MIIGFGASPSQQPQLDYVDYWLVPVWNTDEHGLGNIWGTRVQSNHTNQHAPTCHPAWFAVLNGQWTLFFLTFSHMFLQLKQPTPKSKANTSKFVHETGPHVLDIDCMYWQGSKVPTPESDFCTAIMTIMSDFLQSRGWSRVHGSPTLKRHLPAALNPRKGRWTTSRGQFQHNDESTQTNTKSKLIGTGCRILDPQNQWKKISFWHWWPNGCGNSLLE